MAPDQLGANRAQRVCHREVTLVRLDLREEYAFEDHVADLAEQGGVVLPVDGVQHLIRFLEHEAAERLD